MKVLQQLGSTALLLFVLPLSAWTQQPASPKRVLILHWDDRDQTANVEFERDFQTALRASAHRDIEFYFEYLESSRFPGEDQSLFLRDYIRQKYAGHSIDVVIANSTPALEFLFLYRAELFPDTPIVFAASQRPSDAQLRLGAGATGVIYANSYRKTVDLALKLHPGTKQVFIVSGAPSDGESWEPMARSDLQGFDAAAITYYTDLPLDELTARLRTLPARSIVLYVWQRLRNPKGKLLESPELLSLIAPSARVPIYGMSFANVGRGIVGGSVWTMESKAAKVAELTVKVLRGTRPAEIPVENTPVVPMFDWRQLQRWGIEESRLPAHSLIRFREPTMWQRHKWRIIAMSVVFGLQALMIGLLLAERHRARRAAMELARSQRVLQESEERFRNMANSAPVLIWVSGPDKLCTFCNKSWLTFTGREMEQELGNGWTEGVHPQDLDRCYATYSSSFEARIAFQMEYRLRRADGEYRSFLCAGEPRFQSDGVFAGFIGSCLDITDLKRAQQSILAGQKLESIGLMTAGIAHDFNNLLGGILASTELVLTEHAGATFEEELLRIKAAAVGGAQIVRQLMIAAGKESPVFEPVDCGLLIREMMDLLKVSIAKGNALKTELAGNLPLVFGNQAQLRQLIMNLVMNATQAIGEQHGEIRVTAKRWTATANGPAAVAANVPDGEYLQLEVADTGCGIPEEARARIFDPFFTTKTAGRGLGLSVVQGVIRAHRGVISVASTPGSGTTFQIWLPCVAQEQKQQTEAYSNHTHGALDEVAPGSLTVLMVEDEEALRLSVSKMLRRRGFAVIEADNGNAAVSLFLTNAERIDVVLLDMILPGKSGRAVLEELRRIQPEVKVIITSAYGRQFAEEAVDGRHWAFIQKPYQVSELERLIKRSSAGEKKMGQAVG
jgi:PAS domain S-box-containing protein